ncbi:MAG: DUF4129 domain-containing protein [Deltaproteobacteria bacterium]|nr:DUF4129 domain-containing protein [Deltaproteobacteria bacterium]
MKNEKDLPLFLSAGAMELIWLYALASFIAIPLLQRPFPLPEAMGTFALAALFTLILRGRGLRVILVLGLHLCGLLLAASKIVHIFFYMSHPFWAHWWLWESLVRPKNFLEWFHIIAVILWVVFFWAGGVTLALRSTSYLAICTRFDVGVTAFFCLLMIKFLVILKGGVDMWGTMPELLLFPFFLFSLLAIGMARNQSSAQKGFLSGYRGIGMIISFTIVGLVFISGLTLIFLPYLSTAAAMGYGLLKDAASPLGPVIVSIIRFLFTHNSRVQTEPGLSVSREIEGSLSPAIENSWWVEIIQKIFGWGLLGLGTLAALIFLILVPWFLFRWFLSRTGESEDNKIEWNFVRHWLSGIWLALMLNFENIASMARGCRDAIEIYRRLLSWGRHSGMPSCKCETPLEYGLRLRRQFPELEGEIEAIAEAFSREVYSERMLNTGQFKKARTAWSRMRSPIHWPSRIKSLFMAGS